MNTEYPVSRARAHRGSIKTSVPLNPIAHGSRSKLSNTSASEATILRIIYSL